MPYGTYTFRLSTQSSTGGLKTIHNLGVGLVLEMLSALIPTEYSYPALPVYRQQAHQGFVLPGPLVLRKTPLKNRTLTQDRDRTVSRRSEPSSRTLLTGEQPDPWDLLQPQDRMSRHRCRLSQQMSGYFLLLPEGSDYTFIPSLAWELVV
jgi:hypothetical protein